MHGPIGISSPNAWAYCISSQNVWGHGVSIPSHGISSSNTWAYYISSPNAWARGISSQNAQGQRGEALCIFTRTANSPCVLIWNQFSKQNAPINEVPPSSRTPSGLGQNASLTRKYAFLRVFNNVGWKGVQGRGVGGKVNLPPGRV